MHIARLSFSTFLFGASDVAKFSEAGGKNNTIIQNSHQRRASFLLFPSIVASYFEFSRKLTQQMQNSWDQGIEDDANELNDFIVQQTQKQQPTRFRDLYAKASKLDPNYRAYDPKRAAQLDALLTKSR